jgi:hypothetical protein
MAHAFDTALERPQRRLIREAIVAQLADMLVPTLPGSSGDKYVAAIVELGAPVTDWEDGDLVDHFRDQVGARSPAIAVALGKRDFDRVNTDARRWAGELDVFVYLMSTSQRGHLPRAAGDVVSDADDTADPGLEVMMEHVFERLAGMPMDELKTRSLEAVSEDFVFVGDEFTVVEQRYEVTTQVSVNPARKKTIKVEVIETTHTDVAAGDPSDVVHHTELPA